MSLRAEVPPTAGLPLRFGDLFGSRVPLEDAMAAQLGVPRPLLECSGTVCLLLALLTLKRRAPNRDRVIVPGYTCPLVVLAVHRAGLRSVACDLRPDHFDLDPDHLATLCDERTLAVVPTHLGGRLADVASVLRVARASGAYVIEDAAQALGARRGGDSVGLQGDAGFFSLAAGKGLSMFEGGLLVARDPQLRDELAWTSNRVTRGHIGWELRRTLELVGYWIGYRPSGLGLAYGLPRRRALARGDLVAAVGDRFAAKFPQHRAGRWRAAISAAASRRLPAFLEGCAMQARPRIGRLRDIDGLRVLDDTDPAASGTWPVLMLLRADRASRLRAMQRLWPSPLGVSRMFIHALPEYPELNGMLEPTDVPEARRFAERMVTISNSPWLDEAGFERIVAILEDACAGRTTEPHPQRSG